MSRTRIVTIVCWSVSALVLIGLAVWFFFHVLPGSGTSVSIGFDNLTGPYETVGSYSEPADGIKSISVDWVSGEVTMIPYEGDTIQITESARRELSENEMLKLEVDRGRLAISYTKGTFLNNMVSKRLELLVPEDLAKELERLDVQAVSADLKISGFDVDSFALSDTSGVSELSDIRTEKAKIGSVSGKIRVSALNASELTLSSTSGDIELSEVQADRLDGGTTSGKQKYLGSFGQIDAGSVSGTIDIISNIVPDAIDCGTTSGDIRVTLPGDSVLDVRYTTTSGDFTSEIPIKNTGKSAAYQFSTVSGDIALKELGASA